MSSWQSRLSILIISLIAVLLFYSHFRVTTYWGAGLGMLHFSVIENLIIDRFILDTFPSFMHGVIAYLLLSLFSRNHQSNLFFAVLLVATFEWLQVVSILPGQFDFLDILAGLLGIFLTFIATLKLKRTALNSHPTPSYIALMTGSLIFTLGCVDLPCEDSTDKACVEPVYLTWDELRVDIVPEYGDSQTLINPGKLFIKDNYLFVVDQYRGVHIFDQTDSQNPMRLAFVPVIGTLDISIKDTYMYLDGFADLVVVNYQAVIDGTFTQDDVTRVEYSFGIPDYQSFLPENYALSGYVSDYTGWIEVRNYGSSDYIYPEFGFIIGYVDAQGNKVIFGDYEEKEINAEIGGKA